MNEPYTADQQIESVQNDAVVRRKDFLGIGISPIWQSVTVTRKNFQPKFQVVKGSQLYTIKALYEKFQ